MENENFSLLIEKLYSNKFREELSEIFLSCNIKPYDLSVNVDENEKFTTIKIKTTHFDKIKEGVNLFFKLMDNSLIKINADDSITFYSKNNYYWLFKIGEYYNDSSFYYNIHEFYNVFKFELLYNKTEFINLFKYIMKEYFNFEKVIIQPIDWPQHNWNERYGESN